MAFGILEAVGNGLPGIVTKPVQVSLRETKSGLVNAATSPFRAALNSLGFSSDEDTNVKMSAKPIQKMCFRHSTTTPL